MKLKLLIAAAIAVYGYLGCIIYPQFTSDEALKEKTQQIYLDIIKQSGTIKAVLPLDIEDTDEVNAYNDGRHIVIFMGAIKQADSWDEVALILGHEVGHGVLGHLRNCNLSDTEEARLAEASADKIGAIYIMKAGYNICKAREFFKRLAQSEGDVLDGSHPSLMYRYAQLNINCE